MVQEIILGDDTLSGSLYCNVSLVVRKPAFLHITATLISALVFATQIVQSLYFLNTKFQASRHLLWLYSPFYVGPGRIPRRPVFSQRGSYNSSYLHWDEVLHGSLLIWWNKQSECMVIISDIYKSGKYYGLDRYDVLSHLTVLMVADNTYEKLKRNKIIC